MKCMQYMIGLSSGTIHDSISLPSSYSANLWSYPHLTPWRVQNFYNHVEWWSTHGFSSILGENQQSYYYFAHAAITWHITKFLSTIQEALRPAPPPRQFATKSRSIFHFPNPPPSCVAVSVTWQACALEHIASQLGYYSLQLSARTLVRVESSLLQHPPHLLDASFGRSCRCRTPSWSWGDELLIAAKAQSVENHRMYSNEVRHA